MGVYHVDVFDYVPICIYVHGYKLSGPALQPNSSKSSRVPVFRPFRCCGCAQKRAPVPDPAIKIRQALVFGTK